MPVSETPNPDFDSERRNNFSCNFVLSIDFFSKITFVRLGQSIGPAAEKLIYL